MHRGGAKLNQQASSSSNSSYNSSSSSGSSRSRVSDMLLLARNPGALRYALAGMHQQLHILLLIDHAQGILVRTSCCRCSSSVLSCVHTHNIYIYIYIYIYISISSCVCDARGLLALHTECTKAATYYCTSFHCESNEEHAELMVAQLYRNAEAAALTEHAA
jgi:hypothetical protein